MAIIRTQKEEEKIIKKGRITCVIVALVLVAVTFVVFDVNFDFKNFWIFRKTEKKPAINAVSSCVVVAVAVGIYMLIEPFTLKIQRFTFNSPNLGTDTIKIAHITDTHIHYPYPQVTLRRMKKIVKLINKEKPDFVVHTGDIMSDNSSHAMKDIEDMVEALKDLEAPLYVCFGNHDVACHDDLVCGLQEIGATILEQSTVEVDVRGSRLYITGILPSLDLHTTETFVQDVSSTFQVDPNCTSILLAHMPDAADAAASSGKFTLQLSGHSHGGQCVLPFKGGTPFLPPGCKKYHACVESNYMINGMILHVSRGIGITPLPYPPIRFLCKPEISIIKLIENSVL